MQIKRQKIERLLTWIKNNPSLIFLGLALVFGTLFSLSLAPLNGTDEFTHFPRAYQISDGTLWEVRQPQQQYGGLLPSNINNMVNDYRDLSRKPVGQQYSSREMQLNKKYSALHDVGKKYVPAVFTSVATYPPWAYIPNVIGIWVAKLLHLPLIWYVYLGRLVALLVWAFLTFEAIRILPKGKWFLLSVALLPTSLTQAATIGADGLLNSLLWLLIALFIAVMSKKVKLNQPQLILILVLSVLASLIKVGYWLIPMLFLVIPAGYFATKTISRIWKSVLVITTFVASLWFTLHNIAVASGVTLTPRLDTYINSKAQISYVLHNPLVVTAELLIQPFTKSYDTIYLGIVGIITNRLIYLSILVIMSLFLVLFITLKNTAPEPVLFNYKIRLWVSTVVVIIGTYLFLALAFYVGNTQVGSSTVFGVYGRYFLPFLPLLVVFPLTIKRRYLSLNLYQPVFVVSILTIGLIATITSLG